MNTENAQLERRRAKDLLCDTTARAYACRTHELNKLNLLHWMVLKAAVWEERRGTALLDEARDGAAFCSSTCFFKLKKHVNYDAELDVLPLPKKVSNVILNSSLLGAPSQDVTRATTGRHRFPDKYQLCSLASRLFTL